MRQRCDRAKPLSILGIVTGVLASASPALASNPVAVPFPGALPLLAVGGAVIGAVALGRRWREGRKSRRRREG